MSVDFNKLKPFRFWCQRILPLVYDDSLSYYELLCKVVDYLNKTIEDVNMVIDLTETFTEEQAQAYAEFTADIEQTVDTLTNAFNTLHDFVDNYFDNLDVQEEIDNKLDEMAIDGTLTNMVRPVAAAMIPGLVAQWLEDNITPTTPAVDRTLSVTGAAADARETGYRLAWFGDSYAWTDNTQIDVLSGVQVGNQNYVSTAKTRGTINDIIGIRAISEIPDAHAIALYKDDEYVGFFTYGIISGTPGYYYIAPGGATVTSIDHDEYAISWFKNTDYPNYDWVFRRPKLAEDVYGLKEDYTHLKDDLPFEYFNIYTFPERVYEKTNWASSTGLSMQASDNVDIYRAIVNTALKYYLVKPSETASSNYVRFADIDNNYLGLCNGLNSVNTLPESTYYMYFRAPHGTRPFAFDATRLDNYNAGYRLDLSDAVYIADLVRACTNIDAINDAFIPSVNLANPDEFTLNKYMTNTGTVGNSNSYFYTGYISVTEGDILYFANNRYIAAFDADKNVVTLSSTASPLTIPVGVSYIVLTGYMSSVNSFMVSKNTNVAFMPYTPTIKNSYVHANNNSLNGNNGVVISADTLAADTTLEIIQYPKCLAQHDRLSGYCKFSVLDEILFGYGYGSNKYVGVDNTNINIYSDGALVRSEPHGITISDYLAFSVIMDGSRVGNITINSTGGKVSATISLSYAKNGLPFIRSKTALTAIKLTAICDDIKNPIWWFGDSYSSLAPERIIGQLNNYHMIDNMLIDATPGLRSYYNATTGAYIDFIKLAALSKPKYVIWSMGMNDTLANYQTYLTLLKNYCDANNITLYAVKIPSVPGIDNTGKNTLIDTLGINSIDWADAVNATSAGVWYSGYLSSDNVHPTVKGAQAMAARTIVDCPAIMQF